jgi:hypothetical protein
MTGAVSSKKDEIIRQHQITKRKTDREFLSNYLYDKGEVLYIAEAQFRIHTRTIVRKIVGLIKSRQTHKPYLATQRKLIETNHHDSVLVYLIIK